MPSLSYGLNITKKPTLGQRPAPAKRKTIFDDDDDDDSGPEDGPEEADNAESISTIGGLRTSPTTAPSKIDNPLNRNAPHRPSKPPKISQFGDLSTRHTTSKHSKTAQGIDPSIYDYDAAYDSIHAASSANKPIEDTKADKEHRPKYMENLLAAAEVRKRDQLRAKEKMLAKEREAEGDEFKDKEKFVTGAYKRQQEEMRRLEEEEKLKEQAAMERQRREGGGMKAFYKDLLGRDQAMHEKVMKAVEEGKGKDDDDNDDGKGREEGKSEADVAREKGVLVNEEGEVVDKRQLLGAGLNAAAGGEKVRQKVVDPREKYKGRERGRGGQGREDESRRFEEQMLGKRSASPEEDSKVGRAAKSRKMEDELLAAMGSP